MEHVKDLGLVAGLLESLRGELTHISQQRLAAASEEISRRYRDKELSEKRQVWTSDLRKGYLAVRLPATLAVMLAVLAELRLRGPEMKFRTLLDLGAGPGTAAWAAAEAFPDLARATLIEQDHEMAAAGRRLAAGATHEALRCAQWRIEDLTVSAGWAPCDLVVASYLLGEIQSAGREQLLDKAWNATASVLCLVEPGTPRGFACITAARQQLISRGAKLLAPCPHEGPCPMKGDDWCHFVQRLQRSIAHRNAKGGTLSYEDEKYSYLIASRHAGKPAAARVVRRPMLRSGHVVLDLCSQEGLVRRTVSRSEKDLYRGARKAAWGDGWEG